MTLRHAFALAACLLMLAGCSALPTPPQRRAAADMLAERQGWQATTLPAGAFDLAAWLPPRIARDDALTVYIEGDGLAWLAADLPSFDPTPLTPLALELALAQPAGNAAYLARPCQYVASARCAQRYWTSERFAPEVVAATNAAVEALKERFGARRLTLVGYSGGAAVAALVAARRDDVARLVTVAGNLDHGAWTALHRITPLTGSLNPVDAKAALGRIPQWHFVGTRDRTVPPALVQAFAADMPAARVIVLDGFEHKCCWAENWSKLWKEIR
ncbi:MAG: alpha/beta hydrolase [Rhodocyclaceae bacterium]|nr:alpha/beta hydrolase [Rhodocyclaceae bacterium]